MHNTILILGIKKPVLAKQTTNWGKSVQLKKKIFKKINIILSVILIVLRPFRRCCVLQYHDFPSLELRDHICDHWDHFANRTNKSVFIISPTASEK